METKNQSSPAHPALSHVEGIGPTLLEKMIEAVVFAADEPVTKSAISTIFSDVSGNEIPSDPEIEAAIERINDYYEAADRAFRVQAWAGGYRMATVSEMAPFIQAHKSQHQKRRITRSLMETVAILSYRQPVTKADIESVRGVSCDYSLGRLLEHGLIDVVGRSDQVGRPLLYGTTPRFLELFGLNSVADLPNLREIEEILDDPAFQKERAKILMTSALDTLSREATESGDTLGAVVEASLESDGDPHAEI